MGDNFTECPVNTYKSESGPQLCQDCPLFSTSPPGSANIDACECTYGRFALYPRANKCQEYYNQEQKSLGKHLLIDNTMNCYIFCTFSYQIFRLF